MKKNEIKIFSKNEIKNLNDFLEYKYLDSEAAAALMNIMEEKYDAYIDVYDDSLSLVGKIRIFYFCKNSKDLRIDWIVGKFKEVTWMPKYSFIETIVKHSDYIYGVKVMK